MVGDTPDVDRGREGLPDWSCVWSVQQPSVLSVDHQEARGDMAVAVADAALDDQTSAGRTGRAVFRLGRSTSGEQSPGPCQRPGSGRAHRSGLCRDEGVESARSNHAEGAVVASDGEVFVGYMRAATKVQRVLQNPLQEVRRTRWAIVARTVLCALWQTVRVEAVGCLLLFEGVYGQAVLRDTPGRGSGHGRTTTRTDCHTRRGAVSGPVGRAAWMPA